MTTYYEILSDGTVGRSTESEKMASVLGLRLTTEQEIIFGSDGKRYFKGEEPNADRCTYVENRLSAYPSIGDQLDMIYWDQVNNTHLWQETITDIKQRYPKE